MAKSIRKQRQGVDPAASNAVLVRSRQTTRAGKNKATWIVSSDFAPGFDAVSLVDAVSMAILEAHYQAVSQGLMADGSGAQPALDPKGRQARLAAKGKRPNHRGVTNSSNKLADNLTRTKLKLRKKPRKLTSGVEGTSASCTIEAGFQHQHYVQSEADGDKVSGGVEFFFTEGAIDTLIDEVIRDWTDVAFDGECSSDTAEHKAKQ